LSFCRPFEHTSRKKEDGRNTGQGFEVQSFMSACGGDAKLANEFSQSLSICAAFHDKYFARFISYRAGTSASSLTRSSTPGPSALLRRSVAIIYSFQTRPYKGICRTATATAPDKDEDKGTTRQEIVGEDLEERKFVTGLLV
jgi:hypothetical protein